MYPTLQRLSMYEIRQDHYGLVQMIEDADGEVTEEILQALQLNEVEFQDKSISYGFVIKEFEAHEEIIDKEIKRLQDLKLRAQKKQQLFKEILSNAMQEYKYEKIETPTMKLSFRKSEAVNITDEFFLPEEFKKIETVTKILKDKIKAAIKEGKYVNGAELVTRKNLQIK